MHYKIEIAGDHLRAELFSRETAEETQRFLSAVADKALTLAVPRVLICVRNSRPIFKVENYRLSEFFKLAAANPAYRVALLGDSDEIRAAQQYVEVLARQQRVNVRAFRAEPAALQWLRGEGAQSQEKR